MRREEYSETQRGGKHKKNVFMIFGIILKQSKKERKTMATNY